MSCTQEKTFPIPVSYLGIALGLSAFGIAWRQGLPLMHVSDVFQMVDEVLLVVSALIWALFIVAYVVKWVVAKTQAKAEFRHEVQCCFISLIPIVSILQGLAALPYFPTFAQVLIWTSILLQLLFSAYRAGGLWRGNHPQAATLPSLYLPTVAANFVSATAVETLGHSVLAQMFFGMAMFSWLMLEPAILLRLRNLDSLKAPLRPLLGIQLAPAFVAANSYLHLNGGVFDFFAFGLIGYSILIALFLIRIFSWIYENGFTASFWGFSFGLASMIHVGVYMLVNADLVLGGWILIGIGTAAIVLLTWMTLLSFIRGTFFLK